MPDARRAGRGPRARSRPSPRRSATSWATRSRPTPAAGTPEEADPVNRAFRVVVRAHPRGATASRRTDLPALVSRALRLARRAAARGRGLGDDREVEP